MNPMAESDDNLHEPSRRMAELQEAGHGDNHDYVVGSPHLRHAALFDRVDRAVTETIRRGCLPPGNVRRAGSGCRTRDIHGVGVGCRGQRYGDRDVTTEF